jgi:hypothetical protein
VTFSKEFVFTNQSAGPIGTLQFSLDIFQETNSDALDLTDTFSAAAGVTFPGIGPCGPTGDPVTGTVGGVTPGANGISNFDCTLSDLQPGVPQTVLIQVTSTNVEAGDTLRFQLLTVSTSDGAAPVPTGILQVVGS